MKKILMLSAAALALAVAGPAGAAGTPSTITWGVTGSAADYCVLGQQTGGANSNSTFTETSPTGNAETANITITAFQDAADHPEGWSQQINFQNSVCNVKHRVKANSVHHGLKYSGTNHTSDPAFAQKVDYNVQASWQGGPDGAVINASTLPGTLIQKSDPRSGDFVVTLIGNADPSELLLAGDYQDTITVTITPVT